MAGKAPALGKRIDRFFGLHLKRLALEREAKKIKTVEHLLRDELIEAMNAAKPPLESVTVASGTISLTRPEVAQVEDWVKIHAWIKKTGTFEIMQLQLHQGNINEQYENSPALAKRGIPGVKLVRVTKFHPSPKKGSK